jgi:hypothetical protein
VVPAPEPVADLRVFQDLCDKVDAAESVGQLNAAAAATGRAHKAKQINAEQFATIGDAVKRKRTLIGAPKPPKSEPSVPDPDPNNGAEIDETPVPETGEEG